MTEQRLARRDLVADVVGYSKLVSTHGGEICLRGLLPPDRQT
jgi:hypothetical protein